MTSSPAATSLGPSTRRLWLVRTTPGAYGRSPQRVRRSARSWTTSVTGMASRSGITRTALAAALSVAVVVLLAGCGDDKPTRGPDPATAACRGHWKDLRQQVSGHDEKTNPSALAERWNSVVATIDYYASTAKPSGCDEAIKRQKEAITALTQFEAKLAPYDMELRLGGVRKTAEAYAAGPAPSPSPTPKGKKGDKKKAEPAPPTPDQVAAALKALTSQAPVATEQQGPGWQQARVVELSDSAAVTKAVKDLAFLSSESPAWRKCAAYLAQIKSALAAAAK